MLEINIYLSLPWSSVGLKQVIYIFFKEEKKEENHGNGNESNTEIQIQGSDIFSGEGVVLCTNIVPSVSNVSTDRNAAYFKNRITYGIWKRTTRLSSTVVWGRISMVSLRSGQSDALL